MTIKERTEQLKKDLEKIQMQFQLTQQKEQMFVRDIIAKQGAIAELEKFTDLKEDKEKQNARRH